MPGRRVPGRGTFPVCVKDSDFGLHQAVTQPYCTSPDMFALPFAPVNFQNRGDWTMAFDETPALASLTAAQLAGVKRLLNDNGYKVGAIDGLPNKPTGAALADFRKKMRFRPQDGNDVLFAALEKRAETISAPQGYAVCNDSGQPLLAAIAQTGPGKTSSRGWWQIAPKACARVLATPLTGSRSICWRRRWPARRWWAAAKNSAPPPPRSKCRTAAIAPRTA